MPTILEEAVRIGAKHQVTIPQRISKAFHLKAGDHMLVRLAGDSVELVPASLVPRDQLWFGTSEWQQMEHEADEDIVHDRIKEFESAGALLRDLKS